MAITRSQSSAPGDTPAKTPRVKTMAPAKTPSKESEVKTMAPLKTPSKEPEVKTMAPLKTLDEVPEMKKSSAPVKTPSKVSNVKKSSAPVKTPVKVSERKKSSEPVKILDRVSEVKKSSASVRTPDKVSEVKESSEPAKTLDKVSEVKKSSAPVKTPVKVSEVKESSDPAKSPDKVSEVKKSSASVKTPDKVSEVKESSEPAKTLDKVSEVKKSSAPVKTPDKVSEVKESSVPVKTADKVSEVKKSSVPVKTAEKVFELKKSLVSEVKKSSASLKTPGKVSEVKKSSAPVKTPDKVSEVKKSLTPVKKATKVSGVKSLELVATADNIAWLAATPELVQSARAASEFLFSALAVNKESQLEKLLTENFDPEQIWQQIDLQATPVLSLIKKSLRKIEKSPPEALVQTEEKSLERDRRKNVDVEVAVGSDIEDVEDVEDDEEDEEDEEDEAEKDVSGDEDDMEEDSKSGEEFSDYDEEEKKAVEDKFLKLSDMEKFLDRADAEDAGIAEDDDDDAEALSEEDEEDEEDDDEDLEMDEAFDFSARLAGKEKGDEGWGPKYSDFIGNGKKEKPKPSTRQDESEADDLEEDDDVEEEEEEPGTMDIDQQIEPVEEKKLSAHERQQEKTKRRIEKLEMANLESKDWTMQGEVSASRRSKNSALEVELDFEHVARPAPVITEEHRQSLEDMIRSRIIEGRFDDPQPRAAPSTTAPKERIEMDEEKSKKGLGEIYEQEYMETTGLAVAATPAMETLKSEAKILFKKLCNRLDALSHFHFAPKPTVEEMEVKVDVPALAMEEVAPLAISDASMLAPEEVYKSAGIVKGESELTPEERKRRRAQKKRKRKGAKTAEDNLKKIRMNNAPMKDPLKELNVRSTHGKDKRTTSSFSKSTKVFAELDKAQERGNKAAKTIDADKPTLNASSLKL